MSKKLYEENYIYDIACALREKCGDEGITYRTCEMADAIRNLSVDSDGGNVVSPESGLSNCNSMFAWGCWDDFINGYGENVTFEPGIQIALRMFMGNSLPNIPFVLNFDTSYNFVNLDEMFRFSHITTAPTFTNCNIFTCNKMFADCTELSEFPEDWANGFGYGYMTGAAYSCSNSIFTNCHSLRTIPMDWFAQVKKAWGGGMVTQINSDFETNGRPYTYYDYEFSHCYALDELVGLPVVKAYNFTNCFDRMSRVKNFTFALGDGATAQTAEWQGLTLDLSNYVGYCQMASWITDYNSDLDDSTRVTDDDTYQELKDTEDWWTTNVNYSRYNHDSAVATLQSLPDCSAYIASQDTYKTNTIKFKGASGALTDGGAINTLTEAEIAVATAKGWTVTLV